MRIEPQGDGDQAGMFPVAPAEAHARRALEHASMYAADLAIARWSGADPVATPARAAWLANAQEGLLQWFDAGGFNQDASLCERPANAGGAAALPFPGMRPQFYSLFRHVGSNAI